MQKELVLFTFFLCSLCCSLSCQKREIEQGVLPKVMAVFPSSDTLPENLLRMYIHFSSPMKTLGNLEKIKLIDEKKQEVVGAIFNNVHELWDHEQKQLTIILDPARVKTGLKAHQEKGRALQVGKQYHLIIGHLEDVDGNPLKDVFTKSFYVSKEDKLAPNKEKWILEIPKAQSKLPLVIQFPQMLDQLSLRQRLQLTDENNQPVDGQIEIAKQETEWWFVPTNNWLAGNYILYVHTRLEDPVGNNLNGLFDHKIGSLKNKPEGLIEMIPITIKP